MLLQGLRQLVAAGGAAVAAVNAAQFCGNFLDGKSFYQDVVGDPLAVSVASAQTAPVCPSSIAAVRIPQKIRFIFI